MKIKTLKIQNYKRIKDLSLQFDPKINIIIGDNEAGKSTIAQALLDLLFVDPSTKAQSFLGRVKPWGSSSLPRLGMGFYALESQYLLSKNFNERTISFENLNTKRKIETYKESIDSLKKMIGISSEVLYRKTAFISQGDVALVGSSDDLLHEITSESESSQTQSNVQGVIKKLQTELSNLNRGIDRPTNTPGPIKIQQEKITNLSKFLDEKIELWKKKQNATGDQRTSGGELEQLEHKILEIDELLNNNKLVKQGRSDLGEINQKLKVIEEKLLSYKDLGEQGKGFALQMKEWEGFKQDNLEDGARQIAELEGTLKQLDRELKKLESTEDLMEQNIETEVEAPRKSFPLKSLLYVLIFLLSLVISLAVFISTGEFMIPAIVTLLGILLICVFFVWGKISTKDHNLVVTPAKEQPLRKLKDGLLENIEKNKVDLEQILSKYNVKSAPDFYSFKANYLSLQTKYADIRSSQRVLLGDKTLDQLEKEQVDLMIKKKEIENTVLTDIVKNSEVSPDIYLEKSRERDKLIARRDKLKEELIVSKTRVGDTTIEYSEIVELEEDLDLAKSQLTQLIKRQKVLSLAIETMKEAVLEVAKSANKVLAETINTNLSRLTHNHYSKTKVNTDLTVQIYAKEKNDWVDPILELSKGTIDQIYFLVRMGFLKLITENKEVPLILDDPFVAADSTRKEKFREILEEYSNQYQIFLFTNDYDYMDWGNVIQLS